MDHQRNPNANSSALLAADLGGGAGYEYVNSDDTFVKYVKLLFNEAGGHLIYPAEIDFDSDEDSDEEEFGDESSFVPNASRENKRVVMKTASDGKSAAASVAKSAADSDDMSDAAPYATVMDRAYCVVNTGFMYISPKQDFIRNNCKTTKGKIHF